MSAVAPMAGLVADAVAAPADVRKRATKAEIKARRMTYPLNNGGATSLICAPVTFGEKTLGLIHLYCTDPHKALDAEDLEFTVAVAKQLGGVTHQMQRQESLTAQNRSLRDQLRVESELVGTSGPMKHIEEQIGLVAGTHATVLIRGESGAGNRCLDPPGEYLAS